MFGLLLAFVVVFRLTFAFIYIVGWKSKVVCCKQKYGIQAKDLKAELQRVETKAANGAEVQSSDDDEMDINVDEIFKTKEKQIRESRDG